MRPIGFFLNILTPVILTTLIIGSRIEASSPPVILWHGMGKNNYIFFYLHPSKYYRKTFITIIFYSGWCRFVIKNYNILFNIF